MLSNNTNRIMKKYLAIILTLIGGVLLAIGVAGYFGSGIQGVNSTVFAILGVVFFIAGISLLRTVRSVEKPTE